VFIWCSRFCAFTEIRIRGVSSKATQPHPCLRTKAQIRFGGSALRRETVHPCIIGFVGLPTMNPATHHRGRARATAGQRQARAAGRAIDPLPVVRLFTPDAHATWLLAALDPADGDTAWGLIDLGIGMPELGPSSCPIWPPSSGRASSP
jgi:hypothetical protein